MREKLLFYILGYVLIIGLPFCLVAKPDSLTTYPLRSFNKAKIQEYASEPQFKYDRKPNPERLSLWQRFKEWLWQKFYQTLNTTEKRTYWLYALYAFCTVLFIYFIIRLAGADKVLFLHHNRNPNRTAENELLAQEIHNTDFDTQIKFALQRQDYRQATRLYYLKTLKLLTDKKYIHWQADKTNYDYYKELPTNLPKNQFKQIIFYFEYAFYGGFSLSKTHFETIQNAFKEIEQNL